MSAPVVNLTEFSLSPLARSFFLRLSVSRGFPKPENRLFLLVARFGAGSRLLSAPFLKHIFSSVFTEGHLSVLFSVHVCMDYLLLSWVGRPVVSAGFFAGVSA